DGTNLGNRAVRWDASATAATELGNLGTDVGGVTQSYANAVNSAGVTVGSSKKYGGGIDFGDRAVRWDASTNASTELGNLGTDGSGSTQSIAYAINTAGAGVGWAQKYTGGTFLGLRAARWNASGTAATELGDLGTDSHGITTSFARAINTAEAAVGNAVKYTG